MFFYNTYLLILSANIFTLKFIFGENWKVFLTTCRQKYEIVIGLFECCGRFVVTDLKVSRVGSNELLRRQW
jgi:hypothetical protein